MNMLRCQRISVGIAVVVASVLALVSSTPETFLEVVRGSVVTTRPQLLIPDGSNFDPSTSKGTYILQDKSKGVTWLLRLNEGKAKAVSLPFPGGNHETAVAGDGRMAVTTHYDTAWKGDGEGGGIPGSDVIAIDVVDGSSSVLLQAESNPLQGSMPHGVLFLDNGDVMVTAQLDNSVVRFPSYTGDAMTPQVYNLTDTGCVTPHLLRAIPDSTLVVTGCRATNPGVPDTYPGKIAVIDVDTGDVAALDTGLGAEGIAVTGNGHVWVAGQRDNTISVYGFDNGAEKSVSTFKKISDVNVPGVVKPLRLAYDSDHDRMGVAALNTNASDPNFYIFDANSFDLVLNSTIESERRGRVNMEGLVFDGNGYFFSGGFDNQAIVFINPLTGQVDAEIDMPRCSMPNGFNVPTFISTQQAQAVNLTGSNNWSGGFCNASMRNPNDTRFLTMDGFEWSPIESTLWAMAIPQGDSLLTNGTIITLLLGMLLASI